MAHIYQGGDYKTVLLTAAIASACMTGVRSYAATGTWNTGDGNWSSFANWAGGIPSSSADTATLGSTSADRRITYDAAASGTLGTLSMTQSANALNMLDFQRSLTMSNSLTIGAGSGTTLLLINPQSETTQGSLDVTIPNLTLNSGGVLELTGYKFSGGIYQQSRIVGNVAVSGGTLNVASSTVLSSASADAISDFISGTLSMSSGALNIGTDPNAVTKAQALRQLSGYVRSTEQRLDVSGNVTITGGTLNYAYGTGNGSLYMNGATNSITGLAGGSTNVWLGLTSGGDQSLVSNVTLSNGLLLRNTNSGNSNKVTKTVGSSLPGGTLNVNQIKFGNAANNGTTTLKLSSDIATTGAVIAAYAPGTYTGITFEIDTNGHTLDMSAYASGFAPANVSSGGQTRWLISNSAGASTPGVIKATSFNMSSAANTYYSIGVGANVSLVAKGGGGSTNNLSTPGNSTIDASSTFIYAGTATTANYARLTSSRTIGNLAVQTGALQLISDITTAATSDTMINSAGTLDLNGKKLSTRKLANDGILNASGTISTSAGLESTGTLNIGSALSLIGPLTLGADSIIAFDIATTSSMDTLNLNNSDLLADGILKLNFANAANAIGTYQLFQNVDGFSGEFTIQSNLSGYDLSFNGATGTLTVGQAVPEPAALGLLGMGIAACTLLRRRK